MINIHVFFNKTFLSITTRGSDAEDGELSGSDDSDGEICEPSTQSVSIFADVKPKKQKPPEIQHETPLRELPEWLAAKRRIPCKYFK